jgi:hypothetical protein
MQGYRFHAALLFILSLAVTTAPRATEPAADPNYAGALWMAESHGPLKSPQRTVSPKLSPEFPSPATLHTTNCSFSTAGCGIDSHLYGK